MAFTTKAQSSVTGNAIEYRYAQNTQIDKAAMVESHAMVGV
jgi:hypothetical protein